MPELPDIAAYIHALQGRTAGQQLQRLRIAKPFLLRTADPPIAAIEGGTVRKLCRVGKRIAFGFDGELWLVLHLMIAGRLHWRDAGAHPGGRTALASFEFSNGILTLTEAGSKHRASLHLLRGDHTLRELDPGGIDALTCSAQDFRTALHAQNHTLKRALTDPRIVDGVGNAYSDEILHAAQLSPIALTHKLSDPEWQRLFAATRDTLKVWIAKLTAEAERRFPEHVTAFREDMAVHGRYGKPCPRCGTPVQRIRYADNETNYCPQCQTGGKLLADRGLSRLLGPDWPRSLEELETLKRLSRENS